MATVKQLQPITLRNRIASAIRDLIFSGELPPGERIVERNWAQKLGVSQAAIREGLHILEHEGLVVKNPHTESRVSVLTQKSVEEVIDLRIILETVAAKACAERLTPEGAKQLEAAFHRFVRASERGNIVEIARRDFEFHKTIWRLSGNETLEGTLLHITTPHVALKTVYYYQTLTTLAASEIELHRRILETIRDRQFSEIETAFVEHFDPIRKKFCPDASNESPDGETTPVQNQ